MNETISKLLKMSLCIIGLLIHSEYIYPKDLYTSTIVEIQHIYELSENYCIVTEDLSTRERFLIETSKNSLHLKETDSINEIYPNDPNLINIGDTLIIEVKPKYEFMQSMIGQSYMHMPDCPAYRYREISSKNSTQPWPMTSPNLNGLHYVPSVDKTYHRKQDIICDNPDCDPILKESNGIFVSYLFSHVKLNEVNDSDKLITKLWIEVVITSDGDLVDPVIIDWKTRLPKDMNTLNYIEKAYLNYLQYFPKNKWIPAQKDGKPVAALMQFPIHIDLRHQ